MKRAGAAQRLIPFMLAGANLEGLTEHILRSILMAQGGTVMKRKGGKTVTKKTLVWSIICAQHKSMTVEAQTDIFLKFFGGEGETHGKVLSDDIASHALKHLPSDELHNEYAGLKDRLERQMLEKKLKEVVTRQKGEHAQKVNSTPDCLKALKPDASKVVLCLDRANTSFEAYYPGGLPTKSVAASWALPGRSMFSTLTYCLDYLWGNHEKKGRAHLVACQLALSFLCWQRSLEVIGLGSDL